MQFSLETIAALATIVGTVIAILAFIQSSAWLAIACLVFFGISVGAVLYARQKRLILSSASTVVEGNSIDSLNVANLRRRVNRTFVIQEAHHKVKIAGEDMEITWMYSGFCKAAQASSMEFSIDSEESIPFRDLACVAFDLRNDPEMAHPIQPVLIGNEGLSKKVSVPFLEPLRVHQPFSISLSFTLHGCLKAGFGYYTSTSSFAHTRAFSSTVHLSFAGSPPNWVRVYGSTPKRPNELLKTLRASSANDAHSEYVDVVEGRDGQSARIYAFWRDCL